MPAPHAATPLLPWRHRRRVEMADTDLAGVVHFSRIFQYMEAAESEFFRALGHPLLHVEDGAGYGFPRVECGARYLRPLRYGDLVEVVLELVRVETRRLHYKVAFYRIMETGVEKTATGHMTTVHVRMHSPFGAFTAHPMPEPLLAELHRQLAAASIPQCAAAEPQPNVP